MHAKFFGIFSSVNFGQGHWIVFQFIKFFFGFDKRWVVEYVLNPGQLSLFILCEQKIGY